MTTFLCLKCFFHLSQNTRYRRWMCIYKYIYFFFFFGALRRNSRWPQKGMEKWFCENLPVDCCLWVKTFVEIAPARSISEINAFLCLTHKFKIAAKNGRKTIFAKTCRKMRVKNFVKIALAHTVSEINAFYAEIQDGRQKWQENDLAKTCQYTLVILCRSKISSKSL